MRKGADLTLTGATVAVAVVAAVTFVAFLGMTPFYSKGEPREAVVAISMLQQGNWILPISLGADIPYKPPMLAWCIAALGWLNSGVVTEFLSRLPSALAMIAMTVAVFRFFSHRISISVGAVAAFVLMTCFEVHRAATSCRVDMLLTAFTVLALLELYRQWERRPDTWAPSLWAALLISGAVLTKGPVGMVLPCGAMFVFRLLKGGRFWPAVVSLGLTGLISLVLPAWWYVAAYGEGGEAFKTLALEENVGRFTGKMTYESHVNPVSYNFVMLLAGLAPYTLLLIFGLFVARWRELERWLRRPLEAWNAGWTRFRAMNSVEAFALVMAVVVFVFYSIPKSKRGVYLLPMYPFLAVGIALLVRWLCRNAPKAVRAFGWVITIIALAVPIIVSLICWDAIHLDSSAKLAAVCADFQAERRELVPMFMLYLPFCAALTMFATLRRGVASSVTLYTLLTVVALYWFFSATIQPAALSSQGDHKAVAELRARVPEGEKIYGYIDDAYGRYYLLGYYLNDRIDHSLFVAPVTAQRTDLVATHVEKPRQGYALFPTKMLQELEERYGSEYSFTPIDTAPLYSPTTKNNLTLLRFRAK